MQTLLGLGPYLILPAVIGILMAAGRGEKTAKKGPGGALDKAAALLYRLYRKRRSFPGEGAVYQAEYLLDAPMGARERTRQWYIDKLRILLLFLLAADLVSAALHFNALSERELGEGGVIARNSYGGSDKEVDLEAFVVREDGEEEKLGDYHLRVQARRYTREETEKMAEKAMALLPALILGDNTGPGNVCRDLLLPSSLEGYPFRISWKSSYYALADTDGSVYADSLSEGESEEVTLTALLAYDPWTFEKDIPLTIVPPRKTEALSRQEALLARLGKDQEETVSEERMILTDSFEGRPLIWKEAVQDLSLPAGLALAGAGIAAFFLGDKDLRKKLADRDRQLTLDYPGIASRFALYLGAGMSIRNIFFRLGREYEEGRKEGGKARYSREEILLFCHELESGVSEREAYEHWGRRCHLQQYVRLSSLLGQNLKKGNKALLSSLQEEAAEAFESRRNMARKLGEEAGTKLLLPMGMLLAVTMLIIMVPAYFSFM